jgi:hypothetical protein
MTGFPEQQQHLVKMARDLFDFLGFMAAGMLMADP